MSRLDDLVSDIETAFNDATVNFISGAVNLHRNATQRQAIFVRTRGVLSFVSSPGATPLSTPVAGVGTFTEQRFQRSETVLITLRAADESDLDDLFDRFVNVVFDLYGPNVFQVTNPYQWTEEDSKNSSYSSSRNPSIKLPLDFRLASRSDTRPYVEIADTTADLGIPDETASDAPTVVNP